MLVVQGLSLGGMAHGMGALSGPGPGPGPGSLALPVAGRLPFRDVETVGTNVAFKSVVDLKGRTAVFAAQLHRVHAHHEKGVIAAAYDVLIEGGKVCIRLPECSHDADSDITTA